MFPDQYHDALAASRAFLSTELLQQYGIDPERVCVSGDSAGGNLAAAVAQEVKTPNTIKTSSTLGDIKWREAVCFTRSLSDDPIIVTF